MHVRSPDIAEWLRTRVVAAGARGLAVHISGGVGPAVVAGLCALAMPERVIGVITPSADEPGEAEDARSVAEHFRVPAVLIPLESVHRQLAATLEQAIGPIPPPAAGFREEAQTSRDEAVFGLLPRLRMASLYFMANALRYLVAGSLHRSDLIVGNFTKYGSGSADLHPIGHLLESDVRALARDLRLPDHVIQKPARAPRRAGIDQDDIGFTPDALERYLRDGPEAVPPAVALRIERLIRTSEHKRNPVPTYEPE